MTGLTGQRAHCVRPWYVPSGRLAWSRKTQWKPMLEFPCMCIITSYISGQGNRNRIGHCVRLTTRSLAAEQFGLCVSVHNGKRTFRPRDCTMWGVGGESMLGCLHYVQCFVKFCSSLPKKDHQTFSHGGLGRPKSKIICHFWWSRHSHFFLAKKWRFRCLNTVKSLIEPPGG